VAWSRAGPPVTSGLKVDKIYLETHRDGRGAGPGTLDAVKRFFKSKGVETAGGIATVVNERNRFETFVYNQSRAPQEAPGGCRIHRAQLR